MTARRPVVVGEARVTAAEEPPVVVGFVTSVFPRLVREAARRCLGDPGAPDNLAAGRGDRTAILLASQHGDASTLDEAGRKHAEGTPLDPLLFHQTVTTAILGLIAHEHGITGPVTCLATPGDLRRESLDMARLLLADEVEQVLLISVELAPTERVRVLLDRPGEHEAPGTDSAQATLLRRAG
jgi:hypothetical protein